MDQCYVPRHAIFGGELRGAAIACEGALLEVHGPPVFLEVAVLAESAVAQITLVGPQAFVYGAHMLAHISRLCESMPADGTLTAVGIVCSGRRYGSVGARVEEEADVQFGGPLHDVVNNGHRISVLLFGCRI